MVVSFSQAVICGLCRMWMGDGLVQVARDTSPADVSPHG